MKNLSVFIHSDDRGYYAESIEWCIDGQTFSQSNDLAPRPPPSPPSPVSKLARRHREIDKERKTKLLTEGGGGGYRGAESYDRKKAWSSMMSFSRNLFFLIQYHKVQFYLWHCLTFLPASSTFLYIYFSFSKGLPSVQYCTVLIIFFHLFSLPFFPCSYEPP